MKKLLLTTSIVSLSLCGALAGDGKSFKEVKTVVTPEPPCRFRDMEFQIDGFYTQFFGSHGSRFKTGPGGGFGLNFFFLRYFGIGYEAAWYDNGGTTEHLPVGGNLFLRYPICALNLAPYIMVGGGVGWDGDAVGYGNVGGGLEYRFTDHIGAFVDGRWFYGNEDFGNSGNLRAGMRFAF
ncbi:MAG TPA: hypothetical protein VIS71_03660 [Terrimicrobium sp.]